MSNAFFEVPIPKNEPVKAYTSKSTERIEVIKQYDAFYNSVVDIPNYIGDKKKFSKQKKVLSPPHDHKHIVGYYSSADEKDVEEAISEALASKKAWASMPWEQRLSIFLKAADLISNSYRSKINATTMIGQSKTIHQAEIDAACEFIDFLRFNVKFATQIYKDQPISDFGIWNRMEYRALEGFVYAVSPFNFTAIAGNLPVVAAMMGNTVVWKPSDSQVYSANITMELFQEAGLPPGVINMVCGDPKMVTDTVLSNPNFAGIHFTGSTAVFKSIWTQIGQQIEHYKNYPKIVGETGGKDFIVAHHTADTKALVTAIIRGAFEFQGQKCSAASRVYIPNSLSDEVLELLELELKTLKMGSPRDFSNFVTAVIHESSFDKLVGYIELVKSSKDAKIIIGGGYDKSKGYFIEPTVVLTTNPHFETMTVELFGPIVTIYVYQDAEWIQTLELVDSTSPFALTGAVFSKDRYAIVEATKHLEQAAGNFYINDKPTGAVVGQQPFGGGRASGTNDKAGSILNLLRWVSPRLIKETFNPPKDYKYPFMS